MSNNSGGYTNPNELFGMHVSENDDSAQLARESEERDAYRDDNSGGGFNFASLLRKRTR